jgi:hypothetical protein
MKVLQAATMLALIASPALAQNTVNPNVPSAQSPAIGATGRADSDQVNGTTLHDPTRIAGKPGGKSGPAVMPPSRSAQSR